MKKTVFFIALFQMIAIFSYSQPQIVVSGEFLSQKHELLKETEYDLVYIKPTFYYFLEDYSVVKLKQNREQLLQPYFGKPAFQMLYIENHHLKRHFYIIQNSQKDLKEGFYQVAFKINNTIQNDTYVIYIIELINQKPVSIQESHIKKQIMAELKNHSQLIACTQLKKLSLYHKKINTLVLKPESFILDEEHYPARRFQLIGIRKNHYLFRFLLGTADSKSYEGYVARGNFCYIDYTEEKGIEEIYFTVAEFSVYTK